MNTGPLHGARYVIRGMRLITLPGLRRYVAAPLLINTLLFGLIIWYGTTRFEAFLGWLLPTWLDWLRWLLWPLFAASALLIVFYTFTLIANLIGAPFNGLLAEAVERHLTGAGPVDKSWRQLFAEIVPALWSEVRKLLYFVGLSLPFLLLFLIPVVNLAAPFLWIAFSAWMLSLEYVDYPMGNHGLLFADQRARLRERRMTVLGFGGATLLLTMVPVLNFIAMPSAVAGATAMWVEQWRKSAGSGA